MKVHLIDGTYELFRSYFAMPSMASSDGEEVGAVRGLCQSILELLRSHDVTHVACAFDHEITSFRNDIFPGYKTGEGTPEDLLQQFDLAEKAIAALGVVVWPMIEFEADDAIATAVSRWWQTDEVEQIIICSPDKDLAQMVQGQKVVCLDRRRGILLDENGVQQKFGVQPRSIPDYLGLVGDSADGIPGIPRWGAKSTAIVLDRYGKIEDIPLDISQWDIRPRGAATLVKNLAERLDNAIFYRKLATLRTDVPLLQRLDDLEWQGVKIKEFEELCDALDAPRMMDLPHRWDDE